MPTQRRRNAARSPRPLAEQVASLPVPAHAVSELHAIAAAVLDEHDGHADDERNRTP